MRKDKAVKKICSEMKANGLLIDYAYDHFKQSEALPPPFAVYRRVAGDNFSADGIVYKRGDMVDFEIYADTPEEMEKLMEAAEEKLTEADIYYRIAADTVYIESEDFYETLYEI